MYFHYVCQITELLLGTWGRFLSFINVGHSPRQNFLARDLLQWTYDHPQTRDLSAITFQMRVRPSSCQNLSLFKVDLRLNKILLNNSTGNIIETTWTHLQKCKRRMVNNEKKKLNDRACDFTLTQFSRHDIARFSIFISNYSINLVSPSLQQSNCNPFQFRMLPFLLL